MDDLFDDAVISSSEFVDCIRKCDEAALGRELKDAKRSGNPKAAGSGNLTAGALVDEQGRGMDFLSERDCFQLAAVKPKRQIDSRRGLER